MKSVLSHALIDFGRQAQPPGSTPTAKRFRSMVAFFVSRSGRDRGVSTDPRGFAQGISGPGQKEGF